MGPPSVIGVEDDDEERLEDHGEGLFEDWASPEAPAGEDELRTLVGSPSGQRSRDADANRTISIVLVSSVRVTN